MSASPEQFQAQDDFERLKAIVPYVGRTGGAFERDTFPTVAYHAYTGKETLGFDDFFDGSAKGVDNQMFGPGLYCGTRELAGLYDNYFEAHGHKVHGVEKVLANYAVVIDMNRPEARGPMTDVQRASALEFIQARRNSVSTNEERQQLQEFEAYINGNKQVQPTIYDIASGEGYFPHTAGNIPPSLRIGWLMSLGIDGVTATITPRVGGRHEVMVYWRRDNVADPRALSVRMNRLSETRKTMKELGSLATVEVVAGQTAAEQREQKPGRYLMKSRRLSTENAETIVRNANRGSFLSPEQGEDLLLELRKPHLDTFQLMQKVAAMSPTLDHLLSAETGVWERYRLHEHTQAVMNQFEDNWVKNIDPTLTHAADGIMLARLMFLIHDMGKPLASSLHGSPAKQGEYNELVARKFLRGLPLPDETSQVLVDIVKQDMFGTVFKRGDKSAITQTATAIKDMLLKHEEIIDPNTLFQLLFVEHECDAAAYTDQAYYRTSEGQKAYSKAGLNRIFKPNGGAVRRVRHTYSHVVVGERLIRAVNEQLQAEA